MACGTPGGDQQDQWQLCFLLAHFAGGLDLQAAIDAPAWHITSFPSSFAPRLAVPGEVVVEDRVGAGRARRAGAARPPGHGPRRLVAGPAVRGGPGPRHRPPVRRRQPARHAGVRRRPLTGAAGPAGHPWHPDAHARTLEPWRTCSAPGPTRRPAATSAPPRRRWTTPAGRRAGRRRRRVPGRAHRRRHRRPGPAGRPAVGPGPAGAEPGPGRPRRRRRPRYQLDGRARGRPGRAADARRRPRTRACWTPAPAGSPRCRSRDDRGDVAELDHAGGITTALLHNPSRLRARGVAIGPDGKAAQLGSVLDLRADAGRHRARRGLCGRRRQPALHADQLRRDRHGQLAAHRAGPARPGPGHAVRAAGPGVPGRRRRDGAAGGRPRPARSTGSSAGRTRCSAPTTGRWSSTRPAAARTAS